MDAYAQALYDRLASNPDLRMEFFLITQNAINELHNNGIYSGLSGDLAQKIHDPDPQVRLFHKVQVAKSFAKQFIPLTHPFPGDNGICYSATVNYDPRFVNAITLCFQGGIEGLYTMQKHSGVLLGTYTITVSNPHQDLSALQRNLALLDRMYPEMSVVLQEETDAPAPEPRHVPAEPTGGKNRGNSGIENKKRFF